MKRKLFNHKLGVGDHEAIKKGLAAQTPIYVLAKQIGVDRHVLADYIRNNEELASAHHDREEAFKDSVEYEIQRKILVEKNLNAMMFYADRKMRDRGYGEHIENEQTGGLEGAIVIGEIPESEYPTEDPCASQPLPVQEPLPIPEKDLPPQDAVTDTQPKGLF